MKKKRGLLIYSAIAAVTVLLNLAAWNSTAFCDAYISHVFPVWVSTYGRLTGLAGFSVGEPMLAAGVLLAAAALVLGAVRLVCAAARLAGGRREPDRAQALGKPSVPDEPDKLPVPGKLQEPDRAQALVKPPEADKWQALVKPQKPDRRQAPRGWFLRAARRYHIVFAWILLAVCLVMTLNCFVLYHATPFSEKYFGEEKAAYTVEELTAVRNFVLEQCNRLAAVMERGGDAAVLYEGDMEAAAITCMKELGRVYDRLAGYYPRPKPLAASDFFCQQYMQGYYFPFSMEANYNDVMYLTNKPSTMCHELAHLRGYIFEDEANFISYLACIQSEDKVFQYSGYLSVLNYLSNDLFRAVGREAYDRLPQPSELVRRDNIFVEQREWDRINGKALIDTETVDRVSDVLVDATLKANGVADGTVSYSRVVRLLLQYYGIYGLPE